MRKILIALFILLSCQTFSQVQEFILNNGLKILVKEDHRAPIAISMIWYNVGSSDEPGGITGISHVIEHMMFKGTVQYPQGVFSKTIADVGGQSNAFTSTDYTAFFEKLAAPQLAIGMKLEADRMNHLLMQAKEFNKEIKVIQEERRMRTDDNPQALAFERFLATAHLSSPYSHPVIGWMSDLKQLELKEVKAWYQTYYGPNNATLVVVGDVQANQVLKLATQYFDNMPKIKLFPRKNQVEPPALGLKQVKILSSTQIPLIMIGYAVPGLNTAKNSSEAYTLELIAGILDAGDSSRFSKNLIHKQHVASAASAYYNIYTRYATQFIVYGVPSKNESLHSLKNSLLQEIELLKTHRIDDNELQRVKKQIIAQKTYEKDSIMGQAMELGILETIGLGWKKATDYQTAIQSITPEQIQVVAQHYFQERNSTEAILMPDIKLQGK